MIVSDGTNYQYSQNFPEQSSGSFPYPMRPVFAVSATSDSVMGILSQVHEGFTMQVGDGIFGWTTFSLVPHNLSPEGSGLWPTPRGRTVLLLPLSPL